jgi:endonuclease/exonuclease/phosphatase family metal-dependent hydrolase
VTGVHTGHGALIRQASDHVPLAVDFRIDLRPRAS